MDSGNELQNIQKQLEAEATGRSEVHLYANTFKKLEAENTEMMEMHMTMLRQRIAFLFLKMDQLAMLEHLNSVNLKLENTLNSLKDDK